MYLFFTWDYLCCQYHHSLHYLLSTTTCISITAFNCFIYFVFSFNYMFFFGNKFNWIVVVNRVRGDCVFKQTPSSFILKSDYLKYNFHWIILSILVGVLIWGFWDRKKCHWKLVRDLQLYYLLKSYIQSQHHNASL